MRCIFCKKPSGTSKAVEHIVPESLGNLHHVLPKGFVCDSCNQYFARKIERPLLESGVFKFIRADRIIPNKKGRIPQFDICESGSMPDVRIMSRFIGKVGLEILAQRIQNIENWNRDLVEKEELDVLRQYVRFNQGGNWPFYCRTLYPVNTVFTEQEEMYETLHEYDLLYTKRNELYVVIILFGVEYSLNMGGPELEGYEEWLKENNSESHLYIGKNSEPKKFKEYFFTESLISKWMNKG